MTYQFLDGYNAVVCGQERLNTEEVKNGSIKIETTGGSWSIVIKRIDQQSKTTTNIQGTGNVVTGLFTATEENNVVKLTYQKTTAQYSSSNFIVWIYRYGYGNEYYYYESDLLANEICSSYQGEAELELEYSALPEPGVRRVRATVPVSQSQCSGQ